MRVRIRAQARVWMKIKVSVRDTLEEVEVFLIIATIADSIGSTRYFLEMSTGRAGNSSEARRGAAGVGHTAGMAPASTVLTRFRRVRFRGK